MESQMLTAMKFHGNKLSPHNSGGDMLEGTLVKWRIQRQLP